MNHSICDVSRCVYVRDNKIFDARRFQISGVLIWFHETANFNCEIVLCCLEHFYRCQLSRNRQVNDLIYDSLPCTAVSRWNATFWNALFYNFAFEAGSIITVWARPGGEGDKFRQLRLCQELNLITESLPPLIIKNWLQPDSNPGPKVTNMTP